MSTIHSKGNTVIHAILFDLQGWLVLITLTLLLSAAVVSWRRRRSVSTIAYVAAALLGCVSVLLRIAHSAYLTQQSDFPNGSVHITFHPVVYPAIVAIQSASLLFATIASITYITAGNRGADRHAPMSENRKQPSR